MEIIVYVSSAVIALFAIASFVLAFFTYRLQSSTHSLQKSLTIPRLIIYSRLIDEDNRDPAYTVVVRNVGQYPALNVHVEINLEEWRDEKKIASSWDRYDAFGDTIEVLQPQEQKEYELPSSVESYIVKVKSTASNCDPADAKWSVGNDRGAFREVLGRKPLDELRLIMDANSMKDLGKTDEDL